MKKRYYILCCLFTAIFLMYSPVITDAQQAVDMPRVTFGGRVLDRETGEPLIGANVYLANSILGSATNENGFFMIFNVPYGTHDVVATYVGYEVQKKKIRIDGPKVPPVDFMLNQEISELEEVVVAAEEVKGWKDNMRIFSKEFLGDSKNARQCEIINPEVIDFIVDEDTGTFRAVASDIIKVENHALGYRINLYLEQFALKDNLLQLSFTPSFEEHIPETQQQLQRWENERERAYKGSLRHLLSSISKGSFEDEGFVLNPAKAILTGELSTTPLSEGDIRLSGVDSPFERGLSFDDYMMVTYTREGEEELYFKDIDKQSHYAMTYDPARQAVKTSSRQVSYIKLRKDPAVFNVDGSLPDPFSIITYGYMAWERLADVVPVEYEPRETKLEEIFIEELRPETRFFQTMQDADAERFAKEYEPPFLLVLKENEREHYMTYEILEEKKAFIEKYIKSKNLNPLYSVNYWFLEYIGRYYYARQHFALDNPPFFDDRGAYYIKYGRPVRRFEDPGGYKRIHLFWRDVETPIVDPPNPDFRSKPNETWYYSDDENEFTVHFIKEPVWKQTDRLNEALFSQRERDRSWQWLELVKEREWVSPEYSGMSAYLQQMEEKFSVYEWAEADDPAEPERIEFVFDFQGDIRVRPHRLFAEAMNYMQAQEHSARLNAVPNIGARLKDANALDFNSRVAQFKNDDGSTRLDVVVLAPLSEITERRESAGGPDTTVIEYQYVIRDKDFNPQFITDTAHEISLSAARQAGMPNDIAMETANLQATSGELTVQIMDMFNRNRGFRQEPVEVRDFSGDALMISDIQLYGDAGRYTFKDMIPVLDVENVSVVPYPYRVILNNEPLLCFFEVYNIEKAGIRGMYNIEITVKSAASSQNVLTRFFNWLTRSKGIKLSIAQTRRVEGNDSSELLTLDLTELSRGEYTLELAASDPSDKNTIASVQRNIVVQN